MSDQVHSIDEHLIPAGNEPDSKFIRVLRLEIAKENPLTYRVVHHDTSVCLFDNPIDLTSQEIGHDDLLSHLTQYGLARIRGKREGEEIYILAELYNGGN